MVKMLWDWTIRREASYYKMKFIKNIDIGIIKQENYKEEPSETKWKWAFIL